MVGFKIRVFGSRVGLDTLSELWRKLRTIYVCVHWLKSESDRGLIYLRLGGFFHGLHFIVVGSGCLLGPAFDKETEVLSTSALEAFFMDCISLWSALVVYLVQLLIKRRRSYLPPPREAFCMDCILSRRDFIASSMDASKTPICCCSWMLN